MNVRRTGIMLKPDQKKVILKSFAPGNKERTLKIIDRILSLNEDTVESELKCILENFGSRHKNLAEKFLRRFELLKQFHGRLENISDDRKKLIGSYFCSEYSLECSALFNPSMIWHPDQSNMPSGMKRFILSLRATGEGHVSSLVFRTGTIDAQSNITLDPVSKYCEMPEIIILGDDKYVARFDPHDEISERTLFPQMPSESNGIEDARFVRFVDDSDEIIYYATYCAYDGHEISTQLLFTKDFLEFNVGKMNGLEIQNKGMALFPRKINGKYALLSRQDNENNFIMFSNDLYSWNSKQLIMEPEFPWEYFQIGNCGSPIETEKGWLCLSHGVGAMRQYSIGAFLLDKNDPSKLIGRLKQPLLSVNETEREGYVPNVVYTCGGLINERNLVLPYAVSDYSSSFALVALDELLKELTA